MLLLFFPAGTPVQPPPVITGPVAGTIRLKGLAAVGGTLTVDTSALPGSYTYQWVRATPPVAGALPNWQVIGGATSASYTLTQADAGKTVTVVLS